MHRVSLLWKITTWLHGTNFCINCTSLPRFAPSFMQLRNDPKCTKHYETHQNMSLWSNGVDQVRSLRKITTWLHGTNFCINCTSSPSFAPSSLQLRNDPKCTKHYGTHQNMSSGSNGVDGVHSLQKNSTRLRSTNFWINYTNTAHFAPSFMQ